MAKESHNDVLDAALNEIATATSQVLCTTQPANYAGIAALTLATVTMAGGDYTNADDTSGRKVTMAAKAGVSVTGASASGTYVVLHDGVTLLYATTCTSIAVTNGGTVDFPSWKINFADPT